MRWLFVLSLALLAGVAGAAEPKPSSCIVCHRDAALFDEDALKIVQAYRGDVHAEFDIGCQDCHGGNPALQLADDTFAAMDDGYADNPYVGVPERGGVPAFCGRCHSDPVYMKRFRPDAHVDQEREYWTSQHGEALSRGNANVATCVDCHGAHGVLPAGNPASNVHPTRVAETCGVCHADPERMGVDVDADGSRRIDQYARWRQSVHATALLEREDLSAPTCNDCHGNHGATPPGLESVSYVCGQCHGREAEIFRGSPKHRGFEEHNEYLAQIGEASCAACHDDPQAMVTDVVSFGECTSCHGSHGVVRPTLAMFAALPETPCDFCHGQEAMSGHSSLESDTSRARYEAARSRLRREAREAGLAGEALYDWLVDQARLLEAHSLPGEITGDGEPLPRPEFLELFRKFRIGKTHFTYPDPVSGEEVRAEIIRCGKCHAVGDLASDGPDGAITGVAFVSRVRELTSATAAAERSLLTAHRGGVEIREGVSEIHQAVDAQIGLQVLVHTFSVAEDSPFTERHAEGMEHAAKAMVAGEEAQAEIVFRRRGLAVSLLIIVALLVALGAKIRHLSEREARAAAAQS